MIPSIFNHCNIFASGLPNYICGLCKVSCSPIRCFVLDNSLQWDTSPLYKCYVVDVYVLCWTTVYSGILHLYINVMLWMCMLRKH